MPSKLILIGGMSRAGKSLLARQLQLKVPNSIHIDQDDFVLPEEQIPTIKNRIDWEHPDGMNWPLLKSKIQQASATNSLVIVEGIFAFNEASIVTSADLKIYLDLNKEEFTIRRKQETRWGKEPEWYIEHVWTSHLKNANPHQIKFDLSQEFNEQLAVSVISMLS